MSGLRGKNRQQEISFLEEMKLIGKYMTRKEFIIAKKSESTSLLTQS